MSRRQERSGRAGKRAWRVVRTGMRALGLFSIGVFVLVLVALRFAAVRHLVVKQIDDALRPTFSGNVSIESIDRIGLTGVDGVHVRVAEHVGERSRTPSPGVAQWRIRADHGRRLLGMPNDEDERA